GSRSYRRSSSVLGISLTPVVAGPSRPPSRLRCDTFPPHDPSGPFANHPYVRFYPPFRSRFRQLDVKCRCDPVGSGRQPSNGHPHLEYVTERARAMPDWEPSGTTCPPRKTTFSSQRECL